MKRSLMYLALIMTLLLPLACGPSASQSPANPAPASGGAPAATSAAAAGPNAAPTAAGAAQPASSPARQPKGGIRKSSSAFNGTLNLWVLGYTPGNAFANPFDNAVAQFRADNPNIKVEITGYPPNDEGYTKLNTALQGGQGVDVMRLPSDRLPGLVKDGLVESIDPYMTDADKADILPNVLDTVKINGKAYAWPLWVVPMGMYVNKDVFAEAKVPLPPKNWTWEQFVDAAKKTTFKRANGEQVYGFSGFIDAGVINTWALWMNEDPSVRPLDANGKFGFNNDKAYAGLQRFANLALVDKVTPPDFGAQKDSDVKGGFQNKQYAMIVDATGFAPQLQTAHVNFDIYPIPTANGNKLTVGATGIIAVATQKDAAKRQAAMDLARYLTSSEVQQDVPPGSNVPTGFYLAPGARKSVKVPAPLDQFIPMLPDMWVTPLVPKWTQFTRLFHPEYQNTVFGKEKPQQAMQKIAGEAEQLLTAK